MTTPAKADDPMVKAYMIHNSSQNGQLLFADTVQEIPRSVATELRDRGVVRKPTKEELATFKAKVATPNFGEEPPEESDK